MVDKLLSSTILAALVSTSASGGEKWDPPKQFSFVYNVNNSGYVDVCGCKHKEVRQGSLTRRSSFLKQLRATGRKLFIVDGGSSLYSIKDNVKPENIPEAVRKAGLIVETYNRMGYRAMCVGVFDLVGGLANLKELEKKAKFAFVSANLADLDGNLYFRPYIIETIEGVRVAVFGLTLETMPRPFLEKILPGEKPPNVQLLDPTEAARKTVKELEGKADLIVALSHLREETNFELVKKVPGMHIVVDPFIQYGNHHTWIKEHEWIEHRAESIFLRSDGQGARLGVLDLELQRGAERLLGWDHIADIEDRVADGSASADEKKLLEDSAKYNHFQFNRISIEPHHLTDPDIDNLIAQWKKKIDPSRVAHLEATLPHKQDFLTAEKCSSCHEKQADFWKTTKHSRAMASLEQTGDHHRFDCVGCHSLGYGKAFLDTTKMGAYANVQCESCHGTKPSHAADPKANSFGRIEKKACLVCHNKEQTLKEFNFFTARRQVACPKG